MLAPDVLKEEHRAIERMLAILEQAARRLEAGETVAPELFREAAGFLSGFADKCHHCKEEDELFPAMEQAGVPRQGGPIAVMLAEHDEGRRFIRRMTEAARRLAQGDASVRGELVAAVRGYVDLLRSHIYKEDNILFPMAASVLPASEHARLLTAFERIEQERMGPGVHERYHHMLDDMERTVAAW